MRHSFFGWRIARRMKQNGAELECRVVGNAKFPVVRQVLGFRSQQVAFNDGPKSRNFLSARGMRLEPTVILPIHQAHADPRSGTLWAPVKRWSKNGPCAERAS